MIEAGLTAGPMMTQWGGDASGTLVGGRKIETRSDGRRPRHTQSTIATTALRTGFHAFLLQLIGQPHDRHERLHGRLKSRRGTCFSLPALASSFTATTADTIIVVVVLAIVVLVVRLQIGLEFKCISSILPAISATEPKRQHTSTPNETITAIHSTARTSRHQTQRHHSSPSLSCP